VKPYAKVDCHIQDLYKGAKKKEVGSVSYFNLVFYVMFFPSEKFLIEHHMYKKR